MERDRPGFFTSLVKQQTPQVHVDRLLRQPRARQPDHRPGAGRGVRAPQRRQHRGALRPQRAVGDPVRGRAAQGRAHHGGRPLRLLAACRRRSRARASAWPTTGSATSRTCATATACCSSSLPGDVRADALCELNVIEQVVNVAVSTVMVDAWSRGQKVTIHGWAFGVHDGLLQDLGMTRRRRQAARGAVPRGRAAHPLQVEQAGETRAAAAHERRGKPTST